jgi:hypothetical protein
VLGIAVLAGCSAPSGARNPPIPFPDPPGPPLAEKAAAIEAGLSPRHLLPWGALAYRVRLPRDPGGAAVVPYLADQVAWSGALLGAECERWSATRDPAALARVGTLIRGLETLAAVTGRPGLLARFACPAGLVPVESGPGEWHEGGPGFEGWRWRGDLSKDQLAGLAYGLGAVLDLVEEPAPRARAARLLGAVADRLLGRGAVYEDADGRPTTFGNVRSHVAGLPVGVNAAVALGIADAAARATGEPRHRRQFEELVASGACEALPWATVRILGKENFNNPNMTAMSVASVLRSPAPAGDPARARFRAAACTAMDRILRLHRGEGNAFWIAVALPAGRDAGVRERDLRDARAQLARFPLDLVERRIDHAARADLRRCGWDSKRGRAQFLLPLPVDALGAGSFCWKSNPFEVEQNPGADGRSVYSGADFLAAYWPLRRLGVVD